MKKIFSLLLAVAMIFATMVTVSAMNNDGTVTFVPSTTDITVGDTFTVAVRITGDTDTDVACMGGSFVLKPSANVTKVDVVAGAEAAGFQTKNIGANVAKQNINDANGFSGNGDLVVATYTATEAGTFSLKASNTKITFKIAGTTSTYNITAIPELTLTIKDNAPAGPVEEEVTSAAVACAKEWTALKSAGSENTNTYTNVAVATGSVVAGAKEAGFKFVKDDVNNTPGANFVVLDASAIAGEGTTEYTTIMYAVDYSRVTTIYAIPYYVVVR